MDALVHIRPAVASDMTAVHALIHELATYERAPEEHSCTVEQLVADGFNNPSPAFECWVAEIEEEIVGMMLYYTKYSTWKGKCIYLDDIIVTETARAKGVGKKLLDQLIRIARDRKMHRLEWQVLNWNEPAIHFYEKFKVEFDQDWINCRLTFAQLQAYAD